MQNDKRKWQMAFRRFVLENAPSEQYAPYFGLCRKELRAWFEAQFFHGLSWENFGKAWQFEHIIPITWFDSSHEELKACWNFLNIRVSPTEGSSGRPSDLLFAKKHFETLYKASGFQGCQYYLNKLEFIIGQQVNLPSSETIHFLQSNQIVLDAISTFSPAEYQQYLETGSAKSILTEREILKKFG